MLVAGAARAVLAALVVAAAAAAAAAAAGDAEGLDDEVDSAPFAVVIEHISSGWRCGGALVSLRTVLSTASCVRGHELGLGRGGGAASSLPAELWARATHAPTGDGARRVKRIAIATDMDTQGMTEHEQRVEEAWLGAVLDLALVELEAPFGAEARVRPIVMAETREECAAAAAADAAADAAAAACHAVRTPPTSASPLRLANATRAPPAVCSLRAPHWTAIADKVLCFTGSQFCPSDWGVGVVCAGKLCGVLSRSARSAGSAAPAGCGDTHAAQLVPAWRAFVHCAQTLRSCGRDSCAAVCSEHQLLTEPERDGDDPGGGARGLGGDSGGAGGGGRRGGSGTAYEGEAEGGAEDGGWGGGEESGGGGAPAAGEPDTVHYHTPNVIYRATNTGMTSKTHTHLSPDLELPTRTPAPPQLTTPAPASAPPPAVDASPPVARVAPFEFEPNRADFKTGEYGDNAANYDGAGGEETPTRSTTSATPATPRRAAEALQRRVATAAAPRATVAAPAPTDTLRHKLEPEPFSSSAVNRLPSFLNLIVTSTVFYIAIWR